MSSVALELLCTAAFFMTSLIAVLVRGKAATPIVYVLTMSTSLVALGVALFALLAVTDGTSQVILPVGLPWLGAHFRIDPLAAFFLLVVNLGGAAASLYAIGYGRHEPEPHRVLPFFPAFLAGMNLVLLADDAFTFLLSWEFMSIASWALVLAHHRQTENRKAAYVYILMASFGTLALLFAFGILAGPEGGYAFAAIRGQDQSGSVAAVTLVLMLVGAGSKAGLAPLHVWLPLAHPAAPSHVSALMSGVMTKVAVYAFIRVVFDLLGEPTWWASMIVLFLGGITAVLGVLYALMEHDLKRLLAYHTVENIGIIYIGLGLALAFQSNGMNAAAALAMTAALFHVLNHSLFKGLLFFGAGAVLRATGERDMEHLGGLIHRMPYTGFTFLVGCVAISALPPLNGFVSEWLTFQAILQSPELPQLGLKVMVPAIGGMLALSAALAAACFVKAFGVTFLGRPRTPAAERAREVDRFSLSVMFSIAALCLVAGILPGVVIDGLAPVSLSLIGDRMPIQSNIAWLSIVPIAESRSSYNGLLVFAFIALSASLSALFIHRFASRAHRRGPAWGCGYAPTGQQTQYTSASFAQPIRKTLGRIAFNARETVDMPAPGDMRPAQMIVDLRDLIWDGLYAPLAVAVSFAADKLNALQFLTIRKYLSLVFATLVVLLLGLAVWS